MFSVLGENFFSLRNLTNILVASITLLFLAAGETFVIVSGGIDLSIGFVMGLVCVASAIVMRDLNAAGQPQTISVLTGITAGTSLGLIPGYINGELITRFRVPPFIATLGMWGIADGMAWILCEGFPIGFLPRLVRGVGTAHIAYYSAKKGFSFLIPPELTERADIMSLLKIIPIPVLLVTILLIVLGFLLSKTRFGQYTYAIGGNIDAAIRAGISVRWHLIKVYVLSSLCAACAGVMLVFLLNTGVHTQPTSSYELFAIGAVVIGGASLKGGSGSLGGTIVGVLLIQTLNNGLMMMGLPVFYRYIAVGCILIGAVLIDRFFPELVYEE